MSQVIYADVLDRSELKPIIKSIMIEFPVSIEIIDTEKYCGDARSFGYPVDDGLCTVVTYESVMGAMVEDTIALIISVSEKKQQLRKNRVNVSDYLTVSDIDSAEWDTGLSKEWMKTTDNWDGEQSELSTLDDIPYAAWNKAHTDAYRIFIDALTTVTNKHFILKDGDGYSIFDLDDKYFLSIIEDSPNWWVRYHRDNDALEKIKKAISVYNEKQGQIIASEKIIKDNMKILEKMAKTDYENKNHD